MKTIKPTLEDFKFRKKQEGYHVTYTSPVTLKSWSNVIKNKHLIKDTIESRKPMTHRLEDLKRTVKF